MVYVLECMFYAVLVSGGGTDRILQSTGEALRYNDVGVCILGWAVVVLVALFAIYLARYFIKRSKPDGSSNFFNGLIYLGECMVLHGVKGTMYSTGKPYTKNEVAICIICWLYVALIVAAVVLICV